MAEIMVALTLLVVVAGAGETLSKASSARDSSRWVARCWKVVYEREVQNLEQAMLERAMEQAWGISWGIFERACVPMLRK